MFWCLLVVLWWGQRICFSSEKLCQEEPLGCYYQLLGNSCQHESSLEICLANLDKNGVFFFSNCFTWKVISELPSNWWKHSSNSQTEAIHRQFIFLVTVCTMRLNIIFIENWVTQIILNLAWCTSFNRGSFQVLQYLLMCNLDVNSSCIWDLKWGTAIAWINDFPFQTHTATGILQSYRSPFMATGLNAFAIRILVCMCVRARAP